MPVKKRVFLIGVILCFVILVSCNKNTTGKQDREILDSISITEDPDISINPRSLQEKVQKSQKMTIDIFFAISVLHQDYMSTFQESMADMPEKEMREFINKKKIDFFKTIKYSEQEYEDFSTIMMKNPDVLNAYIEKHPEYLEYLSMP